MHKECRKRLKSEKKRKREEKRIQREERIREKEDLELQKRILSYDYYEAPPGYTEEQKKEIIEILISLEKGMVEDKRKRRCQIREMGLIKYLWMCIKEDFNASKLY